MFSMGSRLGVLLGLLWMSSVFLLLCISRVCFFVFPLGFEGGFGPSKQRLVPCDQLDGPSAAVAREAGPGAAGQRCGDWAGRWKLGVEVDGKSEFYKVHHAQDCLVNWRNQHSWAIVKAFEVWRKHSARFGLNSRCLHEAAWCRGGRRGRPTKRAGHPGLVH